MVDCFCMVLTRDSLDDVLQYFPNIAARFRTVAEQRMKEVSRKRSYRRRMEVKSKMEIVDGKCGKCGTLFREMGGVCFFYCYGSSLLTCVFVVIFRFFCFGRTTRGDSG
ncbi:hypothetical protein BC829DRAFT_278356 [Chytridium lagenaria]|nr:hypothetical protein BC829DRAFT_278356 [Chytridium lagenaria]